MFRAQLAEVAGVRRERPRRQPGLVGRRTGVRRAVPDRRAPRPGRARVGVGSLDPCCSPSTPPRRRSPSRCTTARDVVTEHTSERAMKHGEQLAPLIEAALARGGRGPPGPDRDRGRRRPRPVHRAAGRAWSPRARWRTSLELPVYGVCSLDVLAVEAVDTGVVDGDFVVATDARRKEVYLATYDVDGRRASPARSSTSRPSSRPTVPVVGEGASALPGRLPARGRPAPAERRLAGAHHRRGAGRAARPRAALPAPPRRHGGPRPEAGLVIRGRQPPPTPTPSAGSRPSASARTRGRAGSSRRASSGEVPTVHYLVVEDDGEVVGVRRGQHRRRHRRAAADRRTAGRPAARARHRAARRGDRAWPWPDGADRLLLEVREDNDGALAFYAASGLRRDRPPAPLLPRRHHRGRHAPAASAGGCG